MQLSAKELRVLEKFRDVNAKRKKTGSGAKDLVEPLLDSIIKDHLPLDHILYEYIYCVGTNLSRARLADSRWGTPSTAFAQPVNWLLSCAHAQGDVVCVCVCVCSVLFDLEKFMGRAFRPN